MSETDFKTWNIPESPLAVEYTLQVLDEIRLAALSGVEIGGVLFGERGESLVRILTWRPMECQHAAGPSFQLAEAERSALGQQLADAKSDPQLSVLHPVGWFVSHTQGGTSLTESDLELYTHFFPWSWQITLVLQPLKDGCANAGFFVRGSDGSIQTGPLPLLAAPAKTAAPVKIAAPAPIPPRRNILADSSVWLWAALLILVVIVAAVLVRKPEVSPPASVSFHIANAGNALQFAWDKNAKPVREATSGALDIKDGSSNFRLPLDAARLREGVFPYALKTGDLQVLLTVYPAKGPPVQESARFLAPSSGIDESAALRRERDSLAAQVSVLRESLRKETNRNQELQRKIRMLQNGAAVKRARRTYSNHRPK